MERDIRGTRLYREACKFCSDVRQPGRRRISDVAHVQASPDGRYVAFTGTIAERIEEEPPTCIALTELATGATRLLTSVRGTDKLPKFSPDGRTIAYLSDQGNANGFRLELLDLQSGAARETVGIQGSIEQLQWSSDGARILLGVVGASAGGADIRSAGNPHGGDEPVPSWLPWVDPGGEESQRRSCWIYEVASDSLRLVVSGDCNTWEASWAGKGTLAVVASAGSSEGHWYSACLYIIDISTGRHREIYRPADQLGTPVVSPEGKCVAIVEGLCSDRGPVFGDLRFIDLSSGSCRKADTHDVDVLHVQWHSERYLLLLGSRGFETVAGLYDMASGQFSEVWSSRDVGVTRLGVSALEMPGDCVMVTESFSQAPEIAVIRAGRYRRVASFDIGYAEATRALDGVERVTWPSTDGLEIQGWLLRPRAPGPLPLILDVHGGPVAHWKPAFLIRRMLYVPLLLSHGFAVFLPNPRGSSGRGQEFASKVLGDPGGADAVDLLRGLDALIERGVADYRRIGVIGTSYGGFMAAWLITQSDRFAAAVAVSPHTNQVTAQLLSNIPQFMSRLIGDELSNGRGRYFERSPVFHASAAKTPMLSICGELDRCTPAEEAVQFHNALLQHGAESVLVTYGQEGHGIRRLPAMLDCVTRTCVWCIEHIPAISC